MVAIPLNGWFIVVLSTLLHLPIGDASTFRGSCEFPDALGGSRGHGDPPRDTKMMFLFHLLLYLHPIFIPQYTSPSLSQFIYIYIYLYIYLYLYIYNTYVYKTYIYNIYIYLQVHTHIYNTHTNTASINLINAPQNLAISRSRCPCPACRWAATDCASPSVTGRKREQMVDTLQKSWDNRR